jgi:hypothetical protein
MTFCSAPPPIREDRRASRKGGFLRNGFTVAQGFRDRSIDESIWLVSLHYDLGYFDLEQKTLQPLDNPIGTRLSPMSWARSVWGRAEGHNNNIDRCERPPSYNEYLVEVQGDKKPLPRVLRVGD